MSLLEKKSFWVFSYFLIAGTIFLTIGSQNLFQMYPMLKSGIKVEGTVTGLEPQNHRTVNYTYPVNGYNFHGSCQGGSQDPPFEKLKTGDKITIYYNSDDPGYSLTYNPKDDFSNELSFVLLAALIGGLFITFNIKRFFSKTNT